MRSYNVTRYLYHKVNYFFTREKREHFHLSHIPALCNHRVQMDQEKSSLTSLVCVCAEKIDDSTFNLLELSV